MVTSTNNKSTDIDRAILYLKNHGIDAFNQDSILVIPCSSPEEIYDMAGKARRLFKEIGYEKSWRIDPYYFDRKNSLIGQMFDDKSQEIHSI